MMRACCAIGALLFAAVCAHAGAPARGSAAPSAALETIAADPAAQIDLPIDAESPDPADRAAYDKAYAAVRGALQKDPGNASIRIHYAALLVWREAFHPGESGGLRRALDQAIIALGDDPEGGRASAFLARGTILDRLAAELPAQAPTVEQAIRQRIEHHPADAGAWRALVRLLIRTGRAREAIGEAQAFGARFPKAADPPLLEGLAQLAFGDPAAARAAFDAVLKLQPAQRIAAAASLGLAEAWQRLGRPDDAAAALDRARATAGAAALEAVAGEEGLPAPGQLDWSIGKTMAAAGQTGKAAERIGAGDALWAASRAARAKNDEGVGRFKAGDFAGAERLFVQAARLEPGSTVFWINAAESAYNADRYAQAASLYRAAQALEPLKPGEARKLAMSEAVLGNYAASFEDANGALRSAPDLQGLAQWTVVFAYGAKGWDAAYSQWSRTVAHDPQTPVLDLKRQALGIVQGGLQEIAERTERIGAHYAALFQHTLRFRAAGQPLLSYDTDHHAEQAPILARIAAHFRALPFKPVIPEKAAEAMRQAIDATAANDTRAAEGFYARAIDAAPWWSTPHYALAVSSMLTGDARSRREWQTFLSLAEPGDPEERAARQFVERWNAAAGGAK